MTHYDFAVELYGKVMRFIGVGEKGALFAKDGTQTNVEILEAPRGQGVPTIVDANGVQLPVKRVAKPCSCKGGVWRSKPSELVAKL